MKLKFRRGEEKDAACMNLFAPDNKNINQLDCKLFLTIIEMPIFFSNQQSLSFWLQNKKTAKIFK